MKRPVKVQNLVTPPEQKQTKFIKVLINFYYKLLNKLRGVEIEKK